MSNEFGEFIRKRRKELGLTIKEVEEITGISNAYLSQIENGKRGIPSVSVLSKLSNALGVSFFDLFAAMKNLDEKTKNEINELREAYGTKSYREETYRKKFQEILNVPLLGFISAGKPLLAEEHILDWVEVAGSSPVGITEKTP